MRKILFFISLFLWTCGGGGESSPTEPEEPEIPLAYNLELSANEDEILNFSFQDVSSSSTISIVNNTDSGTLSISGSSGTYTPSANFNGSDSFSFRVISNSGLNSNLGYASIVVVPVNDAPIVPQQPIIYYEVVEGYPTINVSLEAEDIENEELTFIIQTNPTYGEVSIEENVASYYTNVDNFDSFKYQACDEQGACSSSREVIFNIDWDEKFFDVAKTIQNENGDYLYFDMENTWTLSNNGTEKTSFLSNYGRQYIRKIVKFNGEVIGLDNNRNIFKTNSNLDGTIQWDYVKNSSECIENFDINSQGNIFFGHLDCPYGPTYYGAIDSNGNEIFYNPLKYKFILDTDIQINALRKISVAVNDSYVYGIVRSIYRQEEKQFQTFAGQTYFSMVEDENQKYDLFVEHTNYPMSPNNSADVKIDISGSEALGPNLQENDINKIHYISNNVFNDGQSGSNGNRYKLIETNFDSGENYGNGGSSTVINTTWIEDASPQNYVPLLVKMDFDGNILETSDLEEIESYMESPSLHENSILAFNNTGPIVIINNNIYKFSDNMIDIEWTISGIEYETQLAKINENEFIYSSNNDLVRVDINGSVIWSVELYNSNFYSDDLSISNTLFIDSDDNILVGGNNQHVMKFDLDDGNKIF
tara:strand:+ start:165 stop:2105 length:1941 start_codon:yes stop_codon:yes gene_type:complete